MSVWDLKRLEAYLNQHGRPVTFYLDKHSVFQHHKRNAKDGQGMTHLGGVLAELNIEISAPTPARPRVAPERLSDILCHANCTR